MFNSRRPDEGDLPTARQLLRSTLIALATAAAILFLVVLPAEYAIDPTGIGRVLGLTQMGEIKRQLAEEAALDQEPAAQARAAAVERALAESAAPAAAGGAPILEAPAADATAAATADDTADATAAAVRSDTMTVSLAPGEGAEIKVWAGQGQEIAFSWKVDGGHVNYDTHGDPLQKKPKGFYHGYGKGRESKGESGILVPAFDGRHGWFWRNRSGAPVTVTLETRGRYSDIRRVV